MYEASTPPIEIQAYTACPWSIDAQNVQRLYEALQAICAGWWLNEE